MPKQSKQPDITIGIEVVLADVPHTKGKDESFLQEYEYVREATKGEIKKPENLEEGLFLIDSKIYTDVAVGGIYMFKNVSAIPETDFLNEGFLNMSLIQVASISEVAQVVFTIKSIDDELEYVVLSSSIGEYIYFCPIKERQRRFNSVINQTEIDSRNNSAIEFIGKTVSIGENPTYLISGKIIEIVVEPYLTKIKFDTESSVQEWQIKADKGCVIFDKTCLDEAEKKKVNEARIFGENNVQIVENYDEFKKRTFYTDKRFVTYPIEKYGSSSFKFGLYCSKADGENTVSGLRLDLEYLSEDWLFIESIILLIDGVSFQFDCDFDGEVAYGSGIRETFDAPITLKLFNALNKITKDSVVKIRLNGSKYYNEFEFSWAQRVAIPLFLKYYKDSGGQI